MRRFRRPVTCALVAVVAVATSLGAQKAPPAQLPRLTVAELFGTYAGAMQLPPSPGGVTAEYGYPSKGLAFNEKNNSLFLTGADVYRTIAELTLVEPVVSNTVSALPRLQERQGLKEVLARTLPRSQKIGGLLIYGSSLVVTGYVPYDADSTKFQQAGHYVISQDFSAPDAKGPFEVQNQIVNGAGAVDGYMTAVPPEYQTELGPYLTGNSNLSIITRTSNGPTATMFDPAKFGEKQGKTVLGYPMDHNTLRWGWARTLSAMVFMPGTRTIAFFGRWSTPDPRYPNDCYGVGTANKELHGTMVPGTAKGSRNDYCYDPAFTGPNFHGTHGFPYVPWVWLIDADDLVQVRKGKLRPWDVKPYAEGAIPIPAPLITPSGDVFGAAYDAAGKRLFVYAGHVRNYGLVHQFSR